MNPDISRREFIIRFVLGLAGAVCLPKAIQAQTIKSSFVTRLCVVHGKNIAQMFSSVVANMGGWKAFIKPGKPVVLKINAAWASLPEQGGNTNPLLVEEFIRQCRAAGAGEVLMPEKPCSPFKEAFKRSGIGKVAARAGGKLYLPAGRDFRKIKIAKGVSLKEAEVVSAVLDSERLINMPVATDAYAATLFEKQPFDIKYIKIAHEMGIGCGDLNRVKIDHIHV